MDSTPPFEGKIALVTGSGRGIGRAIALRLAQDGADLVINFMRNQKPAEEVANLVRETGQRALVVQANVAKPEDVERLFEAAEREFGGLDIFINNAASGFNRPILDQKITGWDWTMNVNARGFLLCMQQAAPLMEKRGGGQVVAISSPGSQRVMPDYVAVGASKAALEALIRYAAVEMAPKNIVVNGVSPSLVETDALKHFASLSDSNTIPRAIAKTPAGRLVTPEDIAGVVSFLCSPAAYMIRGQVLTIDGGYTLIVPD
jgi:enoyl-[acyl-carrier protein] reductase III